MTDVEKVITGIEKTTANFLDKIAEDYLYNPDCLTEDDAREFAETEGHAVYAFTLTYPEFAEQFNKVPTNKEMEQWIIDNCHEVKA